MSGQEDTGAAASSAQVELAGVPEATRRAYASAVQNSGMSVEQAALIDSSDFSLSATPSVDLYLATQGRPAKAQQRPGLDVLFSQHAPSQSNTSAQNQQTDAPQGDGEQKSTAADGEAPVEDGPVAADEEKPQKEKTKFGTFEGVFARCLLNIWGVIMFLRMGWMVAHAGAGLATSIIVVAMCITLITTLSLSAICTNGTVKSGGAYYLISRTLGPQFGGAIGILFSLANATAVALHLIGFAETLFGIYNGTGRGIPYPPPPEYYGGVECPCVVVAGIERCPEANMVYHNRTYGVNATDVPLESVGFITQCGSWDERLIAIVSLCFLISIALVGVEWVVKFQLFLLFLLVGSLITYFVGTFAQPASAERFAEYAFTGFSYDVLMDNINPRFTGGETWISLFAVFFPASTGIMAGANISGDLKDAQKAIPTGTLWAVIVSGITYIAMVWTLASIFERRGGRGGLYDDFAIMMPASGDWWEERKVAPLIIAGIVASSLSSALAALVGAPRVFQAVAKDPLFPALKMFAKGRGANEEPVNAYILTFCIAVGFMMIGSLNAIAPFITNFFMISYALINFACFAADMSGSPGWRPSWKAYNKWLGLLGTFLCLGSMFMISWYVALITIFVCYGLYAYVGQLKPDVSWGDVGQALIYRRAVRLLMDLGRSQQDHVKNYRMSYCVMAGVPGRRIDLVLFFDQLRRGGGLMVAGNVIRGSLAEDNFISPLLRAHVSNTFYTKHRFKAVQEVVVAPTLLEGARMLLLTAGVGKLRPNMLAYGFREAWMEARETELTFHYVESLRDALRMDFAIAVLRNYTHDRYGRECTIDMDLESEVESDGMGAGENDKGDGIRRRRRTSFHADEDHQDQETSQARIPTHVMPTYRWLGKYNRNQQRTGIIDVWWLDDTGGLTILLPHILRKKRSWAMCQLRVFILSSRSQTDEERRQSIIELLRKVRIKIDEVIVVPHPGRQQSATGGDDDESAAIQQTVQRYRDNVSDTEFEQLSRRVSKLEEKSSPDEIDPVSSRRYSMPTEADVDEANALKAASKEDVIAAGTGTGDDDDNATAASQREESPEMQGMWGSCGAHISHQRRIGEIIKQHASDETLLVVVTMPFPKLNYSSQVYMSMLDGISGPCGKPVLFVRGTQKRVLTMDS